MIKFKAIAALLPLLLIIACSKHKNGQFSTWYFNAEAVSNNNVHISGSHGGSSLYTIEGNDIHTINKDNGFMLRSGLSDLPSGGSYVLNTGAFSNNPDYLKLNVYHKGNEYVPSKNDSAYVMISVVNGKRRYELPQAWFINSANGQDSALIKGTFCEP